MHPLSFAIFPTWPFKPPIQISENFHKTRIKRPKKIKNEKDFSFSGEVGIREKQMKKLHHEILFSFLPNRNMVYSFKKWCRKRLPPKSWSLVWLVVHHNTNICLKLGDLINCYVQTFSIEAKKTIEPFYKLSLYFFLAARSLQARRSKKWCYSQTYVSCPTKKMQWASDLFPIFMFYSFQMGAK